MTLSVAVEESTYIITVAFTDEDGASVAPNVVTWTLTDGDGTVINSRAGVNVTPASSIDIVLSGDDLALQSGELGLAMRKLTIGITYDSDAGSSLPGNFETEFYVQNLIAVT